MSKLTIIITTILFLSSITLQTESEEERERVREKQNVQGKVKVQQIRHTISTTTTPFLDYKLSVLVREAINITNPGFMTNKMITDGTCAEKVMDGDMSTAQRTYIFTVDECEFKIELEVGEELENSEVLKEQVTDCQDTLVRRVIL